MEAFEIFNLYRFLREGGGLTLTVASSFFDVIVASFLGIFVPKLVLQLTRA